MPVVTTQARGVLLTLKYDMPLIPVLMRPTVDQIELPIEWRNQRLEGGGTPQYRAIKFTWDKGMPITHDNGGIGRSASLVKISEYDIDVADQTQRLLNLKAILDTNPDCRIPNYDYSAITEAASAQPPIDGAPPSVTVSKKKYMVAAIEYVEGSLIPPGFIVITV